MGIGRYYYPTLLQLLSTDRVLCVRARHYEAYVRNQYEVYYDFNSIKPSCEPFGETILVIT
jgi:hypothetical protein